MYPVLLKLGPLTLHSYGLMIAVGFLIALFFIQRDARKDAYDPKVFADAAFYVLPLGIIGTRLAHIVMYPQFYSWSDPIGWIALWNGGLVFQGAIPVVIPFLYWYFRHHKISFLKATDIIIPYVPLGHAFGRIGCFLYGCCYGKPTELPWGIPARRVPWDTALPPAGSPGYMDHLQRFSDVTHQSHWSHVIHPTQLYSFVGLSLLCLLLVTLRKRWNPFTGFLLPAYFVLYSALRIVIEYFRGDHNPVHMFNLTDQQVFSLFLIVAGIAVFLIMRFKLGKPSKA